MLGNKGFDLWAKGYDESVGISDDDGTYPFAGYKDVVNTIYNEIMAQKPCVVLDVGIGTGTLAHKLYQAGNKIVGVDFSSKMLDVAREKMPTAELISHNFANGYPSELAGRKFDFIVMTYSVHHLNYDQKMQLFGEFKNVLNKNGAVIIGDVAFESRTDHDNCAKECGDEWDDDEFYLVMSELAHGLTNLGYEHSYSQVSHCAGILTLRNKAV